MSINKQRIAAVAALEALGFNYTSDRGWLPPINSRCEAIGGTPPDFSAEGDAMHALLNPCRCIDGRAKAVRRRDRIPAYCRRCRLGVTPMETSCSFHT